MTSAHADVLQLVRNFAGEPIEQHFPELWRRYVHAGVSPRECRHCSPRLCWKRPARKAGCVDVPPAGPGCAVEYCRALPGFRRRLFDLFVEAVRRAFAARGASDWYLDVSSGMKTVLEATPSRVNIKDPTLPVEVFLRFSGPNRWKADDWAVLVRALGLPPDAFYFSAPTDERGASKYLARRAMELTAAAAATRPLVASHRQQARSRSPRDGGRTHARSTP